jgi:hypothetical protein
MSQDDIPLRELMRWCHLTEAKGTARSGSDRHYVQHRPGGREGLQVHVGLQAAKQGWWLGKRYVWRATAPWHLRRDTPERLRVR